MPFRTVMNVFFCIIFLINLSVSTLENDFHHPTVDWRVRDDRSISIHMDNETLCNDGLIDLRKNFSSGRVFSHLDYHNKYFYFPDQHCSITIRTNKRVWLSVIEFQTNSTSTFPRCTEAKYAGNDDRLQIIDGYKNGSILRIICGKDSDKGFDRTRLILKSSTFTLDWQTKSRSFGFELKFVLYDLSRDGKCLDPAGQFLCDNQRCIDRSFLCSDEDYCGDRSQVNSLERREQCPSPISSKYHFVNWRSMSILSLSFVFLFLFIVTCLLKSCRNSRSNKECRGGL